MKTRGIIGHVEVSIVIICLIVFYSSPSGAANYGMECEEKDGTISLFVIDTVKRTVFHSYPNSSSSIFNRNYTFVSDDGNNVVMTAALTGLRIRDRINIKTGKLYQSVDGGIPGWAHIGQCWSK
jgi:hypothetical protein